MKHLTSACLALAVAVAAGGTAQAEDNGVVESTDSDYGAVYLVTDRTRQHWDKVTQVMEQVRS